MHGDVIPREILAKGFEFEGQRVPLVSPQGIFKPKILPEIPLSIATTTKGPYNDTFGKDGLLQYSYRGTDPDHRDNVGLHKAMLRHVPLIYFHSVVPSKYLAIWPVYVVGDSRKELKFKVAADDIAFVQQRFPMAVSDSDIDSEARRSYITRSVRQRLHQRGFRERVLRAYREQCAFCRLRHVELLDAAHIIADSDPEGEPAVTNGISLCKLHHAAFDSNIVGVRPDYIIEVRRDVLNEEDGPMLKHGLVELNKKKIILPSPTKLSPDRNLLEKRYEEFREAS
jgi:putative restriction endonuclease